MRFGINIVSLITARYLLETLINVTSAEDLISSAKAIGYDFVMALPIKGLSGKEEGIDYWEPAWADNSLEKGEEGMLDRLIFLPRNSRDRVEEKMAERSLPMISHVFDTGDNYVEIHNGLEMSPGEIAEKCLSTGRRLVLDTKHIREPFLGKFYLGETLLEQTKTIELLAPWIDLVHVQPQDLNQFINGREFEIEHMLKFLGLSSDHEIDCIAEYHPGFSGFISSSKNRIMASQYLEAMCKLTSGY